MNEIGNSVFLDNSCSYNYMDMCLLCSRYILSWEQAQYEFYIIISGILSFMINLMRCEQ